MLTVTGTVFTGHDALNGLGPNSPAVAAVAACGTRPVLLSGSRGTVPLLPLRRYNQRYGRIETSLALPRTELAGLRLAPGNGPAVPV